MPYVVLAYDILKLYFDDSKYKNQLWISTKKDKERLYFEKIWGIYRRRKKIRKMFYKQNSEKNWVKSSLKSEMNALYSAFFVKNI